MITRYVNTASTAGGNGTTNDTVGANRAYASLSEFEASLPGDITGTDSYTAICTGSTADTTTAQFFGTTTNATHYIKVQCAPGDRSGAHWNTDHYRISRTGELALIIYDDYVWIDGIQMEVTVSADQGRVAYCVPPTANTNLIKFEKCIFKANASGTAYNVIGISQYGTGIFYESNNLFINFTGTGAYNCATLNDPHVNSRIFNNTVIGCNKGLSIGYAIGKNNLVSSGSSDAYTGLGSSNDYNVTSRASLGTYYTSGTHDHVSHTFTFVGGDDYHLDSADTGAIGYGVDLSTDIDYPITDDIDYVTRTGTWDIGCDQHADSSVKRCIRLSSSLGSLYISTLI